MPALAAAPGLLDPGVCVLPEAASRSACAEAGAGFGGAGGGGGVGGEGALGAAPIISVGRLLGRRGAAAGGGPGWGAAGGWAGGGADLPTSSMSSRLMLSTDVRGRG